MLVAGSGVAVLDAVIAMYRRVFTPPYEIPAVLIINALLMTAAWFLLPPAAQNWLFAIHGPLAFPIVLAGWMLGDTPATNVVGVDPDVALAAIGDATPFRTWLAARSIVLGSLVGVPCAIVAVLMGFSGQPAIRVLAACLVIVVLPLGILPVAAWTGLLLPYRPRPLRWRWETRSDRRSLLRWGIVLVAPFVVVPIVAVVILGPSVLIAKGLLHAPKPPLSDTAFVLLASATVAIALLVGWLGLAVATRLARRRRHTLLGYFTDPARG